MNRETLGASKGAHEGDVSRAVCARAEALLRSLNGVADVRVELDEQGRLRMVYVVAASGVGGKALIRNVQSGLRAAFNLAIDPGSIVLMPALPPEKTPVVVKAPVAAPAAAPVAEKAPVAELEPVATPAAARNADRRWAAVGFAGTTPRAIYRPTPQIEVLELHRFNQDQLQCKVVIEQGGQRRTGTAVAGDERSGGVTLAARATLNALQAIEPGEWSFEGAADVIIGGQRHICVSVRKSINGPSLSGAAAVTESVERAVATAVLNAAGLSNVTSQQQNRRLVTK
jgi:hypothetical protein